MSAGQLLLSVALQSPVATQPENFHQSLDSFSSQFTPDLFHIIQYATHSIVTVVTAWLAPDTSSSQARRVLLTILWRCSP